MTITKQGLIERATLTDEEITAAFNSVMPDSEKIGVQVPADPDERAIAEAATAKALWAMVDLLHEPTGASNPHMIRALKAQADWFQRLVEAAGIERPHGRSSD